MAKCNIVSSIVKNKWAGYCIVSIFYFSLPYNVFLPMKFSTQIRTLLSLLPLVAFSSNAMAQGGVFNNRGAVVHINTGAIVRVLGTVTNKSPNASMTNLGDFYIDNNFVNDSVAGGDGIYHVWGNWVNNRTFNAGSGEVRLEGANQLITGDSLTHFYDLTLLGSGIKTQTLNSKVSHRLNLNDRELATEQFDMEITTANTGAITRTTGFVSSLANGKLYRNANVNSVYLFPVGSSVGANRYRPVEITPTTTQAGKYGVRMVNNDATPDGFDRTLVDTIVCRVNDLFYHRINRPVGNVPVTITSYFDPVADQNWDLLAHWTVSPAQWNGMDVTTASIQGNLTGLSHANWNTFTDEPYIIANRRPNPPTITGPNQLCGGTTGNYTIDPADPNATYNWSAVGGNVISGTPTASVDVNFGNSGSGIVSASVTAANGCTSGISSYPVSLFLQPTAIFTTDTNNVFAYDAIAFTDASIDGATSWSWDFGDNVQTTEQNPFHMYDVPGQYTVCLMVTSNDGCMDTTCQTLEIVEGLIVPNVFTPNGDNINDYFHVKNSGMVEYNLQIFNRWGLLMFETTAPQLKWDGTTQSGEQVPAGVYYYVLKAKSATNTYEKTGNVTILYNSND